MLKAYKNGPDCPDCGGSGYAPDGGQCDECGGLGEV